MTFLLELRIETNKSLISRLPDPAGEYGKLWFRKYVKPHVAGFQYFANTQTNGYIIITIHEVKARNSCTSYAKACTLPDKKDLWCKYTNIFPVFIPGK